MFIPLLLLLSLHSSLGNQQSNQSAEWFSLPGSTQLFLIGQEPSTWMQAWTYCYKMDSFLLTLKNPKEEGVLLNYLFTLHGKSMNFWSSANRAATKCEGSEEERLWFWMSNGRPIFDLTWCSMEPNDYNGEEACALLHTGTGCWNDAACFQNEHDNIKHYAICSKENPEAYNKTGNESVARVHSDEGEFESEHHHCCPSCGCNQCGCESEMAMAPFPVVMPSVMPGVQGNTNVTELKEKYPDLNMTDSQWEEAAFFGIVPIDIEIDIDILEENGKDELTVA